MVFTAHSDVWANQTDFPGLNITDQFIHEPELRAIFADAVIPAKSHNGRGTD